MQGVIPGVILAAGGSTRMGVPKALLTTAAGEPFVRRIARVLLAAGVDDLLVVTRPGLELTDALAGLRPVPSLVLNPRPELGQLASLLTAVDIADRPGVEALMVTLVDVPFVAGATVGALIEAYRRTGGLIVRPASGERHGHPVIFDRALFGELRGADPAAGAKPVVRSHLGEIVHVPISDEGAFFDVDTPDAYEKSLRRFPAL